MYPILLKKVKLTSVVYIICCLLCYAIIGNNVTLYPNDVKTLIKRPSAIKTIVIDAGHGGKDTGCVGKYSNEKTVALSIALQFGKLISYYHPEVDVIYTRQSDVFIPLYQRAEIANKNNADLFISIHCNGVKETNAYGTETFVMGLHTADENLAVAKRENASILLEPDYQKNYEGYDPKAPETHIILSMMQNAYLEQSINLADKIEQSFKKRTGMKSRGVKQAGFVVLKRATMPSVLVETGFLTNPRNESLLMASEGQQKIAEAMVKAFTEYKRQVDEELLRTQEIEQNQIKVVNTVNTPTTPIVNQTISEPTTVSTNPVQEPISSNVSSSTKPASPIVTPSPPRRIVHTEPSIVYRVQIAAGNRKPILQKSGKWKKVIDLEIKQEENMYKYLTGYFYSMDEAEMYRSEMLKLGFKGAFIVGYQGNSRIKI